MVLFTVREYCRRVLFKSPAVVAVSWPLIFLGLCQAQERSFSVANGPIHFLAISPSGDLVAVDSFDFKASRHEIVLFDVEKGKTVATFRYERLGSTFGGIVFSRDGKSVIASGGGGGKAGISYWGIADGGITKQMVHQGGVMAMSDRWLITRDFPVCKKIWVYDLETQKEVAKFDGLPTKVTDAAISPDGKHLALQDYDKVLRVLEVATGKEVCKKDYSARMKWMLFVHDEPTLVATPITSGGSAILDLKAGKSTDIYFPAQAISADGKIAARRGPFVEVTEKGLFKEYPDSVYAYSRQRKKVIATFPIEKDWKSGPIQFTPNNRFLVCAGAADGTVRVWDLSKLKP